MNPRIQLKIDDVSNNKKYSAYLSLDSSSQKTCAIEKICLANIIKEYLGPEVYLNFNKNKKLIGIEIMEKWPKRGKGKI